MMNIKSFHSFHLPKGLFDDLQAILELKEVSFLPGGIEVYRDDFLPADTIIGINYNQTITIFKINDEIDKK